MEGQQVSLDPEHEKRIRHREIEGPGAYADNSEIAHADVSTLLNEVDTLRGLMQTIEEVAKKR